MSINIDVLFSIIRVVKVWCGISVSTAGFINNGGMFEFLVEKIQNKTVQTGRGGTICEYIRMCTHDHNLLYIITKDDQS